MTFIPKGDIASLLHKRYNFIHWIKGFLLKNINILYSRYLIYLKGKSNSQDANENTLQPTANSFTIKRRHSCKSYITLPYKTWQTVLLFRKHGKRKLKISTHPSDRRTSGNSRRRDPRVLQCIFSPDPGVTPSFPWALQVLPRRRLYNGNWA